MSFYPQPYKYQCGPFALKYSLVMLGKFKAKEKLEGLPEAPGGMEQMKLVWQKLQKNSIVK